MTFRLGLPSGGYKPYTLKADPSRERTYVGTAGGQTMCTVGDRRVSTRERIAVRAGSSTKIGGREVAGRLSAYITIIARCPGAPPAY